VLVALRIAAGDGEGEPGGRGERVGGRGRQPVEGVEEVLGVLAGGVQADDEVGGRGALGDALQGLAQEGVAGGGLGELQLGGGGLEVVPEEGGVVAVAGGVDADADPARRLWGGSGLWEAGGPRGGGGGGGTGGGGARAPRAPRGRRGALCAGS